MALLGRVARWQPAGGHSRTRPCCMGTGVPCLAFRRAVAQQPRQLFLLKTPLYGFFLPHLCSLTTWMVSSDFLFYYVILAITEWVHAQSRMERPTAAEYLYPRLSFNSDLASVTRLFSSLSDEFACT